MYLGHIATRRTRGAAGRVVAAFCASALLLTAAACASLARNSFEAPVIHLKDVRLVGLGTLGGSLDVVLSVYNPNDFRLDATRLTYNVLVDSARLGSGEWKERANVGAGDSALVTVPVTFSMAELGAVAGKLLGRGTLDYRVTGDITVGTPLGSFTRPYEQRGRYTIFGGGTPPRSTESRDN